MVGGNGGVSWGDKPGKGAVFTKLQNCIDASAKPLTNDDPLCMNLTMYRI